MPATTRVLAAGDFHFPHQHVGAVEAFLGRVTSFRPHHIMLMGDLADCEAISGFSRAPGTPGLQTELEAVRGFLGRLRRAIPKGCEIHIMEGNHERRLHKTLQENPGLYDLDGLKWPNLLQLEDGEEWYPYGEIVHAGVHVGGYHGSVVRKHGGYTARAEREKVGPYPQVLLTGHTHRFGLYPQTDNAGTRTACETGCMAAPDQQSYIAGKPNWNVGWVEIVVRRAHPEISFRYAV